MSTFPICKTDGFNVKRGEEQSAEQTVIVRFTSVNRVGLICEYTEPNFVARFTCQANLVAVFRDLDTREKWKNVNISLAERDGDRIFFY